MKANEFIKKYGWDKVKEVIDSIKIEVSFDGRVCDPCFISEDGDYVSCGELKAFYKSYELVAIHGFEKSKDIVANAPSDDHFYSWVLGDSGVRDKTVNIGEFRKAIADVESCL